MASKDYMNYDNDMPNTASKQKDQEILDEAHDRFDLAVEAWSTYRAEALDDLHFMAPGGEFQWDPAARRARISEGKPVISTDRLNAQVKSLTNAQRQTPVAVKVSPINDSGDKEIADVLQGLMRHIEVHNGADAVYNTAFDHCVKMGVGYWRILTDYCNDKTFEEEIKLQRIANPFSVYIDPTFKDADGSDIKWAFITTDYLQDEYKIQFPDSELATLDDARWTSIGDSSPNWIISNEGGSKIARVAEYFRIKEIPKTLAQLKGGKIKNIKDLTEEEHDKIKSTRDTYERKIECFIINGQEIIDRYEFPGKFIPIVPVFGDEYMENGQPMYSGIVRNSKEEQRGLNTMISNVVEKVAMNSKSPWIGPRGFMGNRKQEWNASNRINYVALEYEVFDDQLNPIPPPIKDTTEPGIQNILQAMTIFENNIKATNNIYDPQMGQKTSNDQSGVAIEKLATQGAIGNYHFSNNLSRAIRLSGLIMLSIIPKVYDTKRVIRIIGFDDKEKLVTINGKSDDDKKNQQTLLAVPKIFDLTVGEYSVDVAAGPSYNTKREASAQKLFDLCGKAPQLIGIIGDKLVKLLDDPVMDAISARIYKSLPPQLQDADDPNNPNAGIPAAIQQKLQEDMQMIETLTKELETTHAVFSKEKMALDTKERIALLERDTKLREFEMQLAKQEIASKQDTSKLIFEQVMAALQAENQRGHEEAQNALDREHEFQQSVLKTAQTQQQGEEQQEGQEQGQGQEQPQQTQQ